MPHRSKADQLLDFEISFYERLLQAYPDFVDVLIPLGDAYTRRGLYEQGLKIDQQLTALRGHDPITWYNLACSLSRLNRIEEAIDALQKARTRGFTDLSSLTRDPDLFNVRQSKQFRQVLEWYTVPSPT